MTNFSVELHDSTLESIEQTETEVRLRLSPAMLHKSHGIPGIDPGEVWAATVEIVFDGVTAPIGPFRAPQIISDGCICTGQDNISMLNISSNNRLGVGKLKLEFESSQIGNLEVPFESATVAVVHFGKFLEVFG